MSDRWPLHPLPWEDEFLSEWIRRIAKSYGISYRVFCLRVLKLNDSEIMYMNDDPSEKALDILSKGTGQPIEVLREMTVPARCRQMQKGFEEGRSEYVMLYAKIAKYFGKENEWLLRI
jgi:hypothetical protein